MLQGTRSRRSTGRWPGPGPHHGAIALIAAVLVAAAPVVSGGGDGDKLPTGEEVFARFIEATGGEQAHKGVHNRVATWELKAPSQGIRMRVTDYAAEPNKRVYIVESESFGTVAEGTDGEIAWKVKGGESEVALKEGHERRQALRDAVFHPFLQWRRIFEKIECAGVEEVDGRPAYRIVATPPGDGRAESLYFDTNSGLLVRWVTFRKTALGEMSAETAFSDYRKVDGLLVPFVQRTTQAGQAFVVRFTNVEYNVDLPEDRFDSPAAAKQLKTRSSNGE